MVTIRDREVDLGQFVDELLVLELDALENYRIAADGLEKGQLRRTLLQFVDDHERHVRDVSAIVRRLGRGEPPPVDVERLETQVKLNRIGGDVGVLSALEAMEDTTNLLYEKGRELHDLEPDLQKVLARGLEDERRHRAWLEEQVARLRRELLELEQDQT